MTLTSCYRMRRTTGGEVHLQQRGLPEQGLKSEHLRLPRGAPPLQTEARRHEPARLLQIHEVP